MGRNMESHQIKTACRVCLASNVKMYSMSLSTRRTCYEQVTGLSMSKPDSLPQALCWECWHQLLRCYRFRSQARRAHCLLEAALEREGTINEHSLKKINRKENGLESKLTQHLNAPDYFDLTLNEACSGDNKQDADRTPFEDDEVKKELDIVLEKDDDSDHFGYDSSDSDKEKIEKIENKNVVAKVESKNDIKEHLFKVTDLTFEEQVQDIEKRKQTDNYQKSEFKCDKCYKGFLYESAFKFHMTRHTNKSGKHECAVCKLRFKSRGAASHHAASHRQKFACSRCPYVTGRLHTAKLHEAFHNGTRYPCAHCDEVFSKQTTYMSHVRVKHPSDIACELCGNSFVSHKGLLLHKKLKHRFDDDLPAQERHRCEQCALDFVRPEALQTHLRAKHHVGVREQGVIARRKKGSDPAAARRNKILARRYVRRAPPRPPVQCEQCDATLPDSRAYHVHFRRQHPDKNRTRWRHHPAMCELCGRLFKCRSLLDAHREEHAAGARVACALCGKTFLSAHRLAVHARVHSAPRAAFACAECGKTFSTRSNLQRHEFSHTGLRPHGCALCGKRFRYADVARAHVQYVHHNKPYPKRARARRKQESKTSASCDGERPLPAARDTCSAGQRAV